MYILVKGVVKAHAGVPEALSKVFEVLDRFGALVFVFVAGAQVDLPDVGALEEELAEADEVVDLVLAANVGVFDPRFLGAGDVVAEEAFVAVAGVSVEDAEVLFLEFKVLV